MISAMRCSFWRMLVASWAGGRRVMAVVHGDETHWRHDGQHDWVWYAGDDDLAFFRWDAHRSTEATQALRGEHFGGVLVADAYAVWKTTASCAASWKPPGARARSCTCSSSISSPRKPPRPRPPLIGIHRTRNPSRQNPHGAPRNRRDYPLNCYLG